MTFDASVVPKRLSTWSQRWRSAPLLLLRVVLGWEFVVSGWLKINDLGDFTSFFGDLGIPFPGFSATLVAWTELVCGGLLLIGLATRLASIPLAIIMTVALATAKRSEIGGLSDLFFQVELTYIAMFITLVILGPGAVSLDRLIASALNRKGERARAAPADTDVTVPP